MAREQIQPIPNGTAADRALRGAIDSLGITDVFQLIAEQIQTRIKAGSRNGETYELDRDATRHMREAAKLAKKWHFSLQDSSLTPRTDVLAVIGEYGLSRTVATLRGYVHWWLKNEREGSGYHVSLYQAHQHLDMAAHELSGNWRRHDVIEEQGPPKGLRALGGPATTEQVALRFYRNHGHEGIGTGHLADAFVQRGVAKEDKASALAERVTKALAARGWIERRGGMIEITPIGRANIQYR